MRRHRRFFIESLEDRVALSGVTALVNAYFDPSTPSGAASWNSLDQAAAKIPIVAIMDPHNGPGTTDPTDYGPTTQLYKDYVNAIQNLHNAGGKVIGYVSTSHDTRPLSDVKQDIDTYNNWYKGLLDGFFIDEMNNLTDQQVNNGSDQMTNLVYYKSIYAYIGNRGPVFGNVGTPFGTPYTGTPYGPEAYLNGAADTLVIFENSSSEFANYPYANQPPPNNLPQWFLNYPSQRIANTVYGETSVDAMNSDLSKAIQNNAGYVYVTDESLSPPSPDKYLYDRLPSYWTQEVGAIASVLRPGQSTYSPNGQFRLTLQTDGNLVEYGPNNDALWASGTNGKPVIEAILQTDGNLVLYGPVNSDGSAHAFWASQTSGHPGDTLQVQNDGNVVIYQGSTPIWATNTAGRT